jgi:hypothetical protein
MPSRFIVFAAASLLLAVALPFATLAEDAAKPSAAQIADGQSKAGVANALIIIGRSAKDPDMLMAAAKLLATIDALLPIRRRPPAASPCSTMSMPSSKRPTVMPPTVVPASPPRGPTKASATTNISATA